MSNLPDLLPAGLKQLFLSLGAGAMSFLRVAGLCFAEISPLPARIWHPCGRTVSSAVLRQVVVENMFELTRKLQIDNS